MDKKYIKTYVTPNLEEYIKNTAEEMGMSQSAFIVMCVNQYKVSMQSLDSMSELKNMITELKTLQLKNVK